jgi:putative membrane protein
MGTVRTGSVVAALLLAVAGAESAAQAPARLSDAEIAGIVVAANSIDAELGDLAAKRATAPRIRTFGETMAHDHRAVNEQAAALVTKLGVTSADSDVSRKLRADAAAFRKQLAEKSGAEFDRAYIAHEVAYHRAVLEVVDTLLIPQASNAELKQTLVDVRPLFVAHLQHAEQLHGSSK